MVMIVRASTDPGCVSDSGSICPLIPSNNHSIFWRLPMNMTSSFSSSAPASSASAKYSSSISMKEVAADLEALVDKTVAAITTGNPAPDEILGRYINVASLVRSISFHEGKLLEQAMIRVAQVNPDLVVLWQSIRLPIVPAALDALSGNPWSSLEGIIFDADTKTRQSYTPDLIVVNKRHRSAFIIDLKRSLASYGDTGRLEELKLKMMAAALVLPDWLYKEHKRIMVDSVGIAIVDGASRPSDHDAGIWGLSEIDDLLEIDGAAVVMAELRAMFGKRVQAVLEEEALRALKSARPRPSTLALHLQPDVPNGEGSIAELAQSERPLGNTTRLPKRITVGFARSRLHA